MKCTKGLCEVNEMKEEEVMNAIKDIYDNSSDVMERLLDVKVDIERNGEYSSAEKGKLLDLRMELDDAVWKLGKIIMGVS